MAAFVVVAEVSVLEAVVVAFGGADDVLSDCPQLVTPSIAAATSREVIVLVIFVFFIVGSSF